MSISTAVVTVKHGKVGAVENFLNGFPEIDVHSSIEDDILILIDAADEQREKISETVLKNKDVVHLLHHSFHFV
jgi:nitrate reductase NapAB chaperone NapD